jgi:hypothetical protein
VQIGNTTTLPEGSSATASTNKDEEQNVIYLNLGIPKGDKGDKGDTGGTNFTTFDIINGKLIAYPEDTSLQPIILGNVAINTAGEYNSATSYEALSLVSYNGSSYIAKKEALNVVPTNTEYWQLVVSNELIENQYNSVSLMKQDGNLESGIVCQTIGYHSADDGGGATYLVREKEEADTTDEMFLIQLYDEDLVAELITNKIINVKQLGAYGDNEHDDTDALQAAFDNASGVRVYLPAGTYLISSSLTLTGSHINIDGAAASIKYTGNDYAIKSTRIRYGEIHIDTIEATSGGCINFNATESTHQFVYLNIYFQTFKASTNCVYAYASDGFINEIRWFNGKLMSGDYGFKVEHDSSSNIINSWKFDKVGVEGVTTGYWFKATTGTLRNFTIFDGRNSESFTTFVKTTGNVSYLNISGSSLIYAYQCNLSYNTIKSVICNPIVIGDYYYNSAIIEKGQFIGQTSNFPNLSYGEHLANNTDLNTILTPGTYCTDYTSETTTITNKPSGLTTNAFKLIVINKQSFPISTSAAEYKITQLIIAGNGIYYRNIEKSDGSSATFGDWVKLLKDSDATSYELNTNKVTSLSSSSTDTQYPSAKCVYDLIGDISSAIDAINGETV